MGVYARTPVLGLNKIHDAAVMYCRIGTEGHKTYLEYLLHYLFLFYVFMVILEMLACGGSVGVSSTWSFPSCTCSSWCVCLHSVRMLLLGQ